MLACVPIINLVVTRIRFSAELRFDDLFELDDVGAESKDSLGKLASRSCSDML